MDWWIRGGVGIPRGALHGLAAAPRFVASVGHGTPGPTPTPA